MAPKHMEQLAGAHWPEMQARKRWQAARREWLMAYAPGLTSRQLDAERRHRFPVVEDRDEVEA